MRQVEAAVEVDAQHRSPPVRGDLVEWRRLIDSGIAHDRVDSTEPVERGLHNGSATFGSVHRVVRGDSGAAGLADLVDDFVGHPRVRAAAGHRATDVVDHHLCTAASHFQSVETAQAPPCPGHDDCLTIKTDHTRLPLLAVGRRQTPVRRDGEPFVQRGRMSSAVARPGIRRGNGDAVMSATLPVNENGFDLVTVGGRYRTPWASADMIVADIESCGSSSGVTGVATSATVGPISLATVCR